MIYPGTVQIETTTACNAHCGFCPHSVMNASGRMADALLDKIIAEIASWDRGIQICPFLTNEPFADSRIFDICHKINELIPKAVLTFFTNASLIDETRLRKLLEIRNIESIHCSLHHTTTDAYERELGISFERTMDNIKRLTSQKRSFPVYVLRVSDGNPYHDGEFVKFCANHFPTTQAYVACRWNWKGDIPSTYAAYTNIICPRHSSLCITSTGKVALCCLDQNADYSIGDVSASSLLDVFNGEIRARYANRPKKDSTPCDRCNMR